MSSTKTLHPSNRRKMQSSTTVVGNNGLPIDAIASLDNARRLIESTTTLSYNAGTGTVTVDPSYDLQSVRSLRGKYTGKVLLIDSNEVFCFIDLLSINPAAGTFIVYTDLEFSQHPSSVSTSIGWEIAEAQLINRLAVTSSAKIDEVVFNGVDIQLSLDGDPVKIVDSDGDELEINPDGSININVDLDAADGDTIAISRHQYPFSTTVNNTVVAAGLNTSSYTQVLSYTSTDDDIRLGIVKVKADTYGVFRVSIDTTVLDYYITSPTDRNCVFDFSEHLSLVSGSVIKIDFIPERIRLASYHFFMRLEGYLEV